MDNVILNSKVFWLSISKSNQHQPLKYTMYGFTLRAVTEVNNLGKKHFFKIIVG